MTKRTPAIHLLSLGFFLCIPLFFSACVSLGHSFNTDRVKSISIGKTTQTDIQKTFGDPFRTGVDSGDVTWTYVDYHVGILGPQRATDLLVKFNPNGTVKSYAFNTDQPDKP